MAGTKTNKSIALWQQVPLEPPECIDTTTLRCTTSFLDATNMLQEQHGGVARATGTAGVQRTTSGRDVLRPPQHCTYHMSMGVWQQEPLEPLECIEFLQ
jgi:hypothetical protein